jgi:hypothetical protein
MLPYVLAFGPNRFEQLVLLGSNYRNSRLIEAIEVVGGCDIWLWFLSPHNTVFQYSNTSFILQYRW